MVPVRAVVFVVTLLLLVAAGCGEADEPTSPAGGAGGTAPSPTSEPGPTATDQMETIQLHGTRWLLSGFGDVDLDMEVQVTLAFHDGHASGNAGCNDYDAQYETHPEGVFDIGDIITTDMACETGMDIEREYLDALARAERYHAIEGRLELMDASGGILLIFGSDEGSSPAGFDGTNWIVTSIDGETTVPGTTVSVSFADGRISAYAGCNSIGGDYTAGDDGAFSAPELIQTAMDCQNPEGVMDRETALVQALNDAVSYRGDDTEIELLDAAGDVRLVLHNEDAAGETIPVEETTWVLTRINGFWTTSWPPTTLIFSMNGPTGTSGCLTYNLWTDYWQDGEFGNPRLSTSDHLCSELGPHGAGEQFFDALSTVTSYEAREHRLQMMDASGAVVLTFRPGQSDHELDGTVWDLLSFAGEPLVADTSITLEFKDGLAVGNGGCNSYGGPYVVVDPGVVSIIDVARTEMGCIEPEGVMEQETAYFDTLPLATSYVISDLGLTLFDAWGETLLVFERQ